MQNIHYQTSTIYSTNIGGYWYFFNRQKADNEVFGEVSNYTAEFWQYDSRLVRRWNVDPVFKGYESPYSCFEGNPVWFTNPKGDSSVWDKKGYMIHYDPNDKDLRVFIQENGKLRLVDELGKTIQAETWFTNLLLPYGDNPIDHEWIKLGFEYYNNSQTLLND